MQNKGTKIKLVLKSPIRRKTFLRDTKEVPSELILDICNLEKKRCDFAYLSYETILTFVRFLKYQTSTWIQKLFLAMTVTSGVVASLPQTLCLITEYQHY